MVKTRQLHRAGRKKVPFPIVALVGYTNAGKSTLFTRLTGASVLAQDMLFATLDPTMRGITLPSGRQVILSDTVGFISDLPPQLVAAFRATLEEVLDADLILHVRDISHPETEEQSQDVHAILADVGVSEETHTLIEVLNKTDALAGPDADAVRQKAARSEDRVAMSALTGEGIEGLFAAIDTALAEPVRRDEVKLPFEQGRARAWLFENKLVKRERQRDDGFRLSVEWTDKQKRQFEQLASEG